MTNRSIFVEEISINICAKQVLFLVSKVVPYGEEKISYHLTQNIP